MDIHFSDEEDYNSDLEEMDNWDEDNSKSGANNSNKKKNDKENKNTDEEDDEDELNKEDELDKDVDEDEEVNIDDDEDEVNMYEDEEDEEDAEGEDDADIEYYPEEDAGDKEEIIVSIDERITSDVLSKYEIVELISIRATQISKGDKPFTDVESLRDPIEMAKKELYDNKCPLLVKRGIGNNMFEYWNPNHMSKPKI